MSREFCYRAAERALDQRPEVPDERTPEVRTPGRRTQVERVAWDAEVEPAAPVSPLARQWLAGLQRHRGAVARAHEHPIDIAMRGPSEPLPHRPWLEAAFGRPLGAVRVHRGPAVTASLAQLGAAAAQRGLDVAFADAEPDRETVAHEIAHVLQNPSGAGAGIAAEGDAAEHDAHDAVARALSGQPGAAAHGLGASPSAVHLLRLRKITQRKVTVWACVDDKPADDGDFNPERASDARVLEVMGELLRDEDYGLVVQVFAAVAQDRWQRIRVRAQDANDPVIAVIGMFLDYPSEVPQSSLAALGGEDGLELGASLASFRRWCTTFDEVVRERGHVPRRVSIEGRHELFALYPDADEAARAYSCARRTLIGPPVRLGRAVAQVWPAGTAIVDGCVRGHDARMNRIVLIEDAAATALELCRQMLVLLSFQRYASDDGFAELCEAIRGEFLRDEERREWDVEPFIALLVESFALPRLASGPARDEMHDKKHHKTEPLFAFANPACATFLGDTAPRPDGSFGFVCNVPTIANGKDKAPIDIANQYLAEALATEGEHSHALVIGLNERKPASPEEQEARRTEMAQLATQIFGFAGFPVVVLGFFWDSDERPCPYGLIRDTLKNHPSTRALVARMRQRHADRVYLHVGDSDPETLQVDERNLFDRQVGFLQQQRQQGRDPDVVGGAYGFDLHEDLRHARAVHTLPELYAMCMSMLLRDVGASVNPMFPYFAEANLLIKASDANLNTSFGVPKKEGQAYLNNLKTSLGQRDPAVASGEPHALQQHFAFDFDLRVVTDARRQANAFRGAWGDLVRSILVALYQEQHAELRQRVLTHLGLSPRVARPALALVLLQQPQLMFELAVACGVQTESALLLEHIKHSHNKLAQCTATTQQYCNRMVSAFGLSSDDQKFSNLATALLFGHRVCDYKPFELGVVLALDPEAEHGPHTLNAFAYGLLTTSILELVDIPRETLQAQARTVPDGYDVDAQLTASLNTRLTTQRQALKKVVTSLRAAMQALVARDDDSDEEDEAPVLGSEPEQVRRVIVGELALLETYGKDARSVGFAGVKKRSGQIISECTTVLKNVRILRRLLARAAHAEPDGLAKLIASAEALIAKLGILRDEATEAPNAFWRVRSLVVLDRLIARVPAEIRATAMGREMISKAVEAARHLFEGKSRNRTIAQHLLRMLDVIALIKNTAHLHDTMLIGLLTGVEDPMQHAELERRKLRAIGGVRATLLTLFHQLAKTQPAEQREDFLLVCVGHMLGSVETLPYATAATLVQHRDKISRAVFEVAKYLSTTEEGQLVANAWEVVGGQLDALGEILGRMAAPPAEGPEANDEAVQQNDAPQLHHEVPEPIPQRTEAPRLDDASDMDVTRLSEEDQLRIAIEQSLMDADDNEAVGEGGNEWF